jgi:hypothetical protein
MRRARRATAAVAFRALDRPGMDARGSRPGLAGWLAGWLEAITSAADRDQR